MVKIEENEDCSDHSNSNTVDPINMETSSVVPLHSALHCVKYEGSLPSSSGGPLKSTFMDMGFPPALVDRVIEENGDADFDMLLDTLFTQSAIQSSNSRYLDPPNGGGGPKDEDDDSSFDLSSCDSQDIEEIKPHSDAVIDKRSALLKMKFPKEDIELALSRVGRDASLSELIDFITAVQLAGNADDIYDSMNSTGSNTEMITTETMFGTMDKTLRLLQMGFTEAEISAVMDKFGPETTIGELADSILASRFACRPVKEEKDLFTDDDSNWDKANKLKDSGFSTQWQNKRDLLETEIEDSKASTSNSNQFDFGERREKRSKRTNMSDIYMKHGFEEERVFGSNLPDWKGLDHKKLRQCPSEPPFFFFGTVLDIPRDAWRKLSSFLDQIEPELVNTQFFSAFIRNEGYLHNLPIENRCRILTRSPKTIQDALPHAKRCWPSWDTRKQLSCLTSETTSGDASTGVTCERLGRMLALSRGILSEDQQADILHECKTMNLIWIGENKLRPIEPDQVEYLLGYPFNHTQIAELKEIDRMKVLKGSFQIDTLGYHLSGLKSRYSDGLRVLSIFSGIGGPEIALVSLGIHLRCVVSVEVSEVNRKILKRWWRDSGQSGVLRQLEGIGKLSCQKIESMIEEFGGFDLVIAGNPCASGNSQGVSPTGVDFTLFVEFARIYKHVRNSMHTSR